MIEFEGASKYWPSKKGIFQIDLKIQAGEVLFVCGRNGAGKTTLISLMAGLYPVEEGKIHRTWNISQIGFLPTADYLEEKLTVSENMAILSFLKTGRYNAWKHLQSLENPLGINLFAYFEIESFRDVVLRELSAGERKKVHLIASLLGEKPGEFPKLLILDEPHNNLDIVANMQLKSLIQELTKTEIAIVLTTHVIETMTQIVGKGIALREGRISQFFSLPDPDLVSRITSII